MRGGHGTRSLELDAFPTVLDALPQQIAVLDSDGVILWVNDAWNSFAADNGGSGFSSIGYSYLSVCRTAPADSGGPAVGRGVAEVLDGTRSTFQMHYPCHAPTELRWFEVQAVRANHPAGLCVVTHHDVTRLHLARQRADRLASTDPLTGLGNRRRFDDFLDTALSISDRGAVSLVLLLVDVDDFKKINDEHGHAVGDRSLRAIANALRKIGRRPSDLVARLGGDEFAVILELVDPTAVDDMIRRAREALVRSSTLMSEQLRSPIELRISVGVAIRDPDEPTRAADLFRVADENLYLAKSGK